MGILLIGLLVLNILTFLEVHNTMATFADLNDHVQEVMDGVAALALEIADLKAGGGPGPVTQDQLDTLDAKVVAIVEAINAAK